MSYPSGGGGISISGARGILVLGGGISISDCRCSATACGGGRLGISCSLIHLLKSYSEGSGCSNC